MNPATWNKVQSVFEAALEVPTDEREECLEHLCAGDAEVHSAVMTLLAADEQPHDLLLDQPRRKLGFADAPPLEGRRVGRYRVIELVGVGGMGEVYSAEDTSLSRQVVLKFLPPYLAYDEHLKERFLREAKAAAAINHPNIVTIHEIGEEAGRIFMAMELVDGLTLREMIAAGQPPLDSILRIMTQVCEGLIAAHDKVIIHRDIKPENIIVTDEGRVKILDFGLARVRTETGLTSPGVPIGTASYMSPEQAQGLDVDERSDIFSVGIVLYEMLSGRPPFKAEGFAATMDAVIKKEAKPLSDLVRGLPEGLEKVVTKCLAKNRDDRYPDVKSLLDELWLVRKSVTGDDEPDRLITSVIKPQTMSLAVLHLRNLSSAADDYICYGISEDLIVDLTRLGRVRVTPLRSVLKYRESDADIQEIAEGLKVKYVLDGSIQRFKDQLRVSVELISADSLQHLWAYRWEEPLSDLPKLKQALAEGVCRALGITDATMAAAEVGLPEAQNPEAYNHYLRGKYAFQHKQDSLDLDVAIKQHRQALDIEPSLLAARVGIAEIRVHIGDFDGLQEELESIRNDARTRGLNADQAEVGLLLARFHTVQSRWDDAQSYCEEALELCQTMGDLAGEARTLGSLVSILLPRARFEEAIDRYDRIIEINRQLDDMEKAAEALKNMGLVYRQKGEYALAVKQYEQALYLARQQKNLSLESACLGNLGNVHLCRNDFEAAITQYELALAIDVELDNKPAIQAWLSNSAHIWDSRGDRAKALELLDQAMKISIELGDLRTRTHMLGKSCEIHTKQGEFPKAAELGKEAVATAEKIDYKPGLCAALQQLAGALFWNREFSDAVRTFHRALELAEKIGLPRNLTWIHLALGELHHFLGECILAEEHFTKALTIAEEIGERAAGLRASGYLLALTVNVKPVATVVKGLEERSREVDAEEDPQASLVLQRLLGEVLCSPRASDENCRRGRSILQDTLSRAQEIGSSPDAIWIARLLDRPTPPHRG